MSAKLTIITLVTALSLGGLDGCEENLESCMEHQELIRDIVGEDFDCESYFDDDDGEVNEVRFSIVQQAVDEGVGSVTLEIEADDSPDVATDVTVFLIQGDPADIGGFEPVTFTFTPELGDPSSRELVIPISDDAFPEGNETFVFGLLVAPGDNSGDPRGFEAGSPSATAVVVVDNDGDPIAATVPVQDADGDGEEDGGLRLFSLPVNGVTAGDIRGAAGTFQVLVLIDDGSGNALLIPVPEDYVVSAGQPILVDVAPGADLSFVGSSAGGIVTFPTVDIEMVGDSRVLVAVGNPTADPLDIGDLAIEGGTLADVALIFDSVSGAFRPISLSGLASGSPDGLAIGTSDVVILQIVPETCGEEACEVTVAAPTGEAPGTGTVIADGSFMPTDGETAVTVTLRPATEDASGRIEAPEPGDTFALRFLDGVGDGISRFDGLDLPSPSGGQLAAFGVKSNVPFAALAFDALERGRPVTVPLIVRVPDSGRYEIALEDVPAEIDGRPVVVELFDGTSSQPVTGDIPARFELEGDSTYVGRFALRVSIGAGVSTEAAPNGMSLAVWPNPSAGVTTVALDVPGGGGYRVVAYDILGRESIVLHDGPLAAGVNRFTVPPGRLAPGTYVVRAQGTGLVQTRFTVVVR